MSEDEEAEEESDADGFVVPNGYVSDDEGVASAQASLDAISGNLSEGLLLFLPCSWAVVSSFACLFGVVWGCVLRTETQSVDVQGVETCCVDDS